MKIKWMASGRVSLEEGDQIVKKENCIYLRIDNNVYRSMLPFDKLDPTDFEVSNIGVVEMSGYRNMLWQEYKPPVTTPEAD